MFDFFSILIIFCTLVNCQLSLIDVIVEFLIALIMATVFVVMIEFHLNKFRFWRFCKVALMELKTSKKKKTSPIQCTPGYPTKKDMLKVIDFMKSHENLILDATSIEKSTEIRYQIAVYEEGLKHKDIDLCAQVFVNMNVFLEKLLKRYKPPRYVVLAAQYFGGLRTLG